MYKFHFHLKLRKQSTGLEGLKEDIEHTTSLQKSQLRLLFLFYRLNLNNLLFYVGLANFFALLNIDIYHICSGRHRVLP